jgi:signal transduction histidine kinase
MADSVFLKQNSIATQLINFVFSIYCVIAVVITIGQVAIEYNHTQQTIQDELKINQQIFEPVLSAGLWNLDKEQVTNTLNGMLAIPIVMGVKIEQNDEVFTGIGIIKSDIGEVQKFNENSELVAVSDAEFTNVFSYQFPINYVFRGKSRQVGTATLYSNSSVIIQRVQFGVLLIMINAIIKTVALWYLFIWVGNKLLIKPLLKLVHAIETVDFDELDEFKINLDNKRENELTIIENAFSDMLKNLADARIEIIKSHLLLEDKVKARTKDLLAAKNEAEQANKAKSDFLSRISHELNTPLNAIVGGSQVLQCNMTQDDSDNSILLKHINTAGMHLSMLVKDIMDFVYSNKDEFEVNWQQCNLNDIIISSIVMVQPFTQAQNITIDYEQKEHFVYADPGRIRQILVNLLNNAVKYNKINGFIEVYTSVNTEGEVEMHIKDSGIGIDSSDQELIFEPFLRLDYAKDNCIDGIGIGLSLVKSLADRMQATVHVNSKLNIGSTFTIAFKAKKEV